MCYNIVFNRKKILVCSHSCLIGMFRAPLIEADAFLKKTEFTMSLMCTGPKKSKLM